MAQAIPDVLAQVTTPLALAALVIIVGAGVLKTVLKKRTTVGGKMLIRYGFALAIILSLSANASYITTAYMSEQRVFSGSVQRPDGEYVSGVVVDVVGVARAVTLQDGSFKVLVPRSVRADSLQVTFSRDGYASHEASISGTDLKPLRVTLQTRQFDFRTDITVTSEMALAHYVGLPELHVPLRFRNPTAAPLTIQGIAAIVTDPNGQKFDLRPIASYAGPGMPLSVPFPQLFLNPAQEFAAIFVFGRNNGSLTNVSPRVNQALFTNPSFSETGPRTDRVVLPDELVEELKRTARANQIWSPGRWAIELRAAANGEVGEKWFVVDVTPTQVAGLEGIYDYYRYGFGLQYGFHYANVMNATPLTFVASESSDSLASPSL